MLKENELELEFDLGAIETPGEDPNKPSGESLNLFKDDILDESEDKELKVDLEDKESPDPNDEKNKQDDPSSAKTVFSVVLGQDLRDRGVLSSFDEAEIAKIAEEKGDHEAIAALLEIQAKANDEEIKSSYDANYQEYLNLTKGGVPKEQATQLQQLETFEKSISGIDLKSEEPESVEARKNLLTLSYRLSTQWSDAKINKHIEKLIDSGEDLEEVDEAKPLLSTYIKSEKDTALSDAKARTDKADLDKKNLETSYKDKITKTEEYFKGEKVTESTKKEIEKLLFTPVKLESGQVTNELWAERDKDPVSWDTKIAYLHSIGYFSDKPLDKFIKNADTKAAGGLETFMQGNAGRDFKSSFNKSFNSDKVEKVDFIDI